MKAAEPVAGDAHVAQHGRVVGDGGGEGVEEGQLVGELLRHALAGALPQVRQPRREPVQAVPRGQRVGQRARHRLGVPLDDDLRAVVLRGIEGVDVDRHQLRRVGLGPVLGHHPVEVAADREHHVGFVPQRAGLGHVGRQADQAWMVGRQQTARRVRGDDRCGQPLGHEAHGLTRAGRNRAPADPYERALRLRQDASRAVEGVVGRFRGNVRNDSRFRGTVLDLGGEQVRRDLDEHRAAGRRDRRDQGLGDEPTQRFRIFRPERRLRHRLEHRALVGHLVQQAAMHPLAAQGRGHVGGDHDDGRARGPRLPHRAERVRGARPGRDEGDADVPARPRVPVGRVGGRLLVAHADEPDGRIGERRPQREVVHAGQAEHDLHPGALERRDHRSRSVHGHGTQASGRFRN